VKDRIAKVVEISGLTKTAFAKRLNISQGLVSQMCSGATKPSDRTISDICREFGCDEVWLRTGVGEPFRQETRQEQIMRFAVRTVKGSDEFRKALVAMLADLTDDEWDGLRQVAEKFIAAYKKE
jgi:transcriptional regulator with XRE-family HTH domain